MDLYSKEDVERLLTKLKEEGDITLQEGSEIYCLIRYRKQYFLPTSDKYNEELTDIVCKWYEAVLEKTKEKRFGNFVTSVPLMYGFYFGEECNERLKELTNSIIACLPLADRVYSADIPDFYSSGQAGALRSHTYKALYKKLLNAVPADCRISDFARKKRIDLTTKNVDYAGPEIVDVLALEFLDEKGKFYMSAECVFLDEKKGYKTSKNLFLVSRDIAEPFERTLKECYWKIWERLVEEGIVINPNPMENNFGRLKGPWGSIKNQALEIFEKVYSDFEIEQRKDEEADKDIWVIDR